MRKPSICVVGPGTKFLSGITYYVYAQAEALSEQFDTSAILIRNMLPKFLYPGSKRVGKRLANLSMPKNVPHFDGIDWFWLPSIIQAICFLRKQRPDTLLIHWWTGSVLHSYLALAYAARKMGIEVVIEFHESLDPGEQDRPLIARYVHALAPKLFNIATRFTTHTEHDRTLIMERYDIAGIDITTIPLATFENYATQSENAPVLERRDRQDDGVVDLLFFGIIRPFKGVDDLVEAFNLMTPTEVRRYRLTVVGETWEGCDRPSELIANSPYKDRINFVNRYVTDEEVNRFFANTDMVVLPYHRSSQSGPLHVAMAYGLPLVVTRVGGLVEGVEGYEGAVLTDPRNPEALLQSIRLATPLVGSAFSTTHTWAKVVDGYASLADIAAYSTTNPEPLHAA